MMKYLPVTILALSAVISCTKTPSAPTYEQLTGQTMGTSYHISFELPDGVSTAQVQDSIAKRLGEINQSMSTYQADSTISRFNQLPAKEQIQIDADFRQVLLDSRVVYEQSAHAFDPTVYPLVELWGFGASMSVERLQNPPTQAQIEAVRQNIGFEKVVLDGDNLSKTADGVGLDFSAIAKGYGVDAVADVLKSHYRINNYMVEIGGEIATSGVNDKGKAWVLAVDKPIVGSTVAQREIMTTVKLSGQSMATSGNYRNMMEYDGKIYSHTINPHTSSPVVDGVPSVTVVADSTAMADGWATALTAISQNDAIKLAQDKHIKALFIIKDGDGWQMHKTDEFIAFEQASK